MTVDRSDRFTTASPKPNLLLALGRSTITRQQSSTTPLQPPSPLSSSPLPSSPCSGKRDTCLCCPSVRFGFGAASPYWTRLGATVSSTLSHTHTHTRHTPSHSSFISNHSITCTLTYTQVQRSTREPLKWTYLPTTLRVVLYYVYQVAVQTDFARIKKRRLQITAFATWYISVVTPCENLFNQFRRTSTSEINCDTHF